MASSVEKYASFALSGKTGKKIYHIFDTDDAATARAQLLSDSPVLFETLPRDDKQCEVVEIADDMWEGTAVYTEPEVSDKDPDDTQFSFDTSGGTQHLTQSLSTIASYAPAGKTAPDFKGAINVTKDSVEGVDIPLRAFAFSVTKVVSESDITSSFLANLYALTATVNNASFDAPVRDSGGGIVITFQAGECALSNVVGSPRGDSNWVLTFNFAAFPNKTGIVVGDINAIAKKGWEYLWILHEQQEDATAQFIVQRPRAAYVEKVLEEGDFSLLGL